MFKNHSPLLRTLLAKKLFYLILLAVLIGVGNVSYFNLKVKGQSETQTDLPANSISKPETCAGCAAKSEQGIYIPLTNLPEVQGSQIVFNSRSHQTMDVTPVFYTADGTVITGDPVSVNSMEIRYVDLKTLIPAEHRNRQDWGGLSLKYYGRNREMWAQFRFLGVNGGNNVDEFFIVESEQRSDIQAATWLTPLGSTSVIALGNVTGDDTSALVQFGSGQTQTVNLAPHATMVIRQPQARQAGKTSESVTITITGAAGSIIPTGLIEAANHNSNSVIRFYDTKSAKQANLYGNGLELKNAIPRMVLNNTSSNPIVATPKFIPTTGITANPILLPPVNLGPNETLEVNLAPLMDAVKKRKDLDVVSVEVNNNGDSGSLIGALYTTEKGTDFSYDIPLRDSGPVRTMTGSYPWKVDDDYSTVVYITNITDLPQEFVGQVNFEGGTFGMKPRRLAPGETAEIDLRKLRDEQKTDDLKRQIPKNIEAGQFRWATHGKTGGKLALIGRAVMKSKSNRIMTSYSCNDPCPPSYSGFLSPIFLRLSVEESGLMTAWEEGHYDQGYDYPSSFGPYQVGGSWSVDSINSSSMTVDGTGATFTGISPGTTNVSVIIGEYQSYVYDGRDCYVNNYTYIISDGGPVDVSPTITSITPTRGGVGSTTRVTINGRGFRSSAAVRAGTGISVSIVSITSTRIVADFVIAANATGGNRSVTVTVAGKTSNSVNFFVQIPTRASAVLSSIVIREPNPGNFVNAYGETIRTNVCGAYRNVTYTLLDQAGNPILQVLDVAEVLTDFVASDPNIPAPQAEGAPTTDQGIFVDFLGVPYPPPCDIPPFNFSVKQAFKVTVGQSTYDLTTKNTISVSKTAPAQWTINLTNTTP